MSLFEQIREEIKKIPVIDVHAHLPVGQLQARDIGDIIFYHFVEPEFYQYVSPQEGSRIELSLEERINRALPRFQHLNHTAGFWCVRKILCDLYGVEVESITADNWLKVQKKVESKANEESWPEEVLVRRANIQKTLTCWRDNWDKEELKKYEFILPLCEKSPYIFGPNHLDTVFSAFKEKNITTMKQLEEVFVESIENIVNSGTAHFTGLIDWNFRYVEAASDEIEKIFQKKISNTNVNQLEGDILATRIFYIFLEKMQGMGLPVQLYLGVRHPMPANRSFVQVNHQLSLELADTFDKFPKLKVSLMCSSEVLCHELTIMARMLPNVSLTGFWWHTFYPVYMEKIIAERIDVLPADKWIAVASDARCVEWSYGKLCLILDCLARILVRKVEAHQLTEKQAIYLIKRVLYENAKEIYNL